MTSGNFLHDLQSQLDDPTIQWQKIVLAIGVGVSLFEGYIGSRQKPYLSPILHPEIPSTLLPYLPASTSQDIYHKSQLYALAKLSHSSFMSLIDQLETFLLLTGASAPAWNFFFGTNVDTKIFGGWSLLGGVWELSGKGIGARGELWQSSVFVFMLTIVGTVLSIPKSYYKNFVLEDKFGFNKMTVGTWVSDTVKGLLLGLALEIPVLAVVISIIKKVGTDAILDIVKYLMLFIFILQLVMIPLYPYFIAPLFNTFTPLPKESPVFPLVEQLATRLNFPLGRVWVMDGSKRSSHSNAFFFGLPGLARHIVIYDTLIEKSEPEEVQAILAHELGHWHYHHVPLLLVTGLLQTGFSFFTFSLFLSNKSLLTSFGLPSGESSIVISLFLAAALFTPLSAILHFGTNCITRALEYQADAFAVRLGKETAVHLKGALVRVHEENLAIYGVDPVYSAYNHNHPTLVERLDALDKGLDGEEGKPKEGKKEL